MKALNVLPGIKATCCQTYIQPILEYAAEIWSPYSKCDITKIEKVQCQAARFMFNDFSDYSRVTAMMKQLNWPSLESRRIVPTVFVPTMWLRVTVLFSTLLMECVLAPVIPSRPVVPQMMNTDLWLIGTASAQSLGVERETISSLLCQEWLR